MTEAAQAQTSIAAVRVLFGAGIRKRVAEEVARLGAARAMILSTPGQSDLAMDLAALLGPAAAGVFSKAAMHTPVSVTVEALAHLESCGADCLIAVGGGSTTGLGKALAYRTDLPQIVIPTTYAGSEATALLGQTENGVKTTLTDPRILPEVILYDPELVASLPPAMTVTSGLNAMAHAAEALYAPNRTAQTDALALDGLHAFVAGLPSVLADPADLDARERTMRGAWACGTVLGRVDMGLHHKLCHTLGGSFELPHAQTHAVILPHAIAYNARSAAAELAPIVDLLGGEDPGLALHRFAASLNAPLALRDLGLKESDLDRATALATMRPYPNPQPVTAPDIRALLQAAWAGDAPVMRR